MILSELRGLRRGLSRGLVLCGVAIALTACGGDDDSAAGDTSGPAPLMATMTIWADVTSHVACGEHVTSIVAAGADPHSFEPSLRDRELVTKAGLVVANGAGLEESMSDLVSTAADEGVPVVTIADHVEVIDGDPHLWQDPRNVIAALDAIESAVVAAGRDAATIGECTDQYRAELTAMDTDLATTLAAVPPDRRVLVTNHDAFGYFAERYGFTIIGTVIPSLSTLGESSAGQLAELSDKIEQYHVPAIFAERMSSATDAEALGNRLGVKVVELDSDALEAEGPASSYIGMMRGNAETIAAALR